MLDLFNQQILATRGKIQVVSAWRFAFYLYCVMIIEKGMDVEGNDCDLMWNTITTFTWEALRKNTLVFCQNIHFPNWYSNSEQQSEMLTLKPAAAVKWTVVKWRL